MFKKLSKYCISIIAIVLLVSALGCSSKLTRNPVPESYAYNFDILGDPTIRDWGDEFSPEFQEDLLIVSDIENSRDYPPNKPGCEVAYSALAISGGGASGAFGTGILDGWSERGDRPVFNLVTGVSTGALIAPFAFLGQEYDEVLTGAYTGVTTKDVAKKKGLLKSLSDESLADDTPLINILNTHVDEKILNAVIKEHAKGRRLYIGTFNMDAQRFVIWNMGAIASSKDPRALELFRKVMLASSSMPAIFPPVFIDYEINGVTYDEMHVDGGVAAQVFFNGLMLDLSQNTKVKGCSEIYVIRNGQIGANYKHIDRNLKSIVSRSVTSMTKASAQNDLLRIYFLAERDGIGFNYVGVPEDFVYFGEEAVDQKEMTALYELGYNLGISDNLWQQDLPGFKK